MSERLIGRGSYGHVMLIGEHPPQIAAKFILIDRDKSRSVYERECRALERLRHQNIVTFYGHKEVFRENWFYFVIHMEFCERYSLRHVLSDPEIVYNRKTVLGWAEHLTSALVCLKANKIVHRDVKPENILVTKDFVLKLGDFGFVKDLNSTIGSASMAGTHRYMSPEASGVLGKITANYQSDLYAVGLCLWEVVERRVVFSEYDDASFNHHVFLEDLRNGTFKLEFSSEENELQEIVDKCTNFCYSLRPDVETVHEWITQLNQAYNKEEFMPFIRKGHRRLIRPDLSMEEIDFTDHPNDSEVPDAQFTPTSRRLIKKVDKTADPFKIELNIVEDLYEGLPSLNQAISNLKLLAVGDIELLKIVERQIRKATKIPDYYFLVIDEVPDFEPIVDDHLSGYFAYSNCTTERITAIVEACRICERCLKREFINLLRGFIEAINWEYRATRSMEVPMLINGINEVHKLIAQLRDNPFYDQWFNRAFFDGPKMKRLQLLSLQKNLFIQYDRRLMKLGGRFGESLSKVCFFPDNPDNQGLDPVYICQLQKGYHIEDLFSGLGYKLKMLAKDQDFSGLLERFHLSKRVFPYSSYIFELRKTVTDCMEITKSDLDFESLSDFEALRRLFLEVILIFSKKDRKNWTDDLDMLKKCRLNLERPRYCPKYMLFYMTRYELGEEDEARVLYEFPDPKNGVLTSDQELKNFEHQALGVNDLNPMGHFYVQVEELIMRIDEFLAANAEPSPVTVPFEKVNPGHGNVLTKFFKKIDFRTRKS